MTVPLASWLAAEDRGGARELGSHFFDGLRRRVEVQTLLRQARSIGKPILVLVIPEDRDLVWDRQQVLGEWLNHGGREALAELASCEVVCVEESYLRLAFELEEGLDPLLFVMIETARQPFEARVAPDDLKPLSRPSFLEDDSRYVERVRKRIRDVELHARDLIAPDRRALEVRERQCRRSLDTETLQALEAFLADPTRPVEPDLELVDRGAAMIRLAIQEGHPQAGHLLECLAQAAERRLLEAPPHRARWARSTGCGMSIEEEDSPMAVGCGMGHIPEISTRFLYFYTVHER